MTTISKNLEALRKRLDLSQQAVANYLEVSHTIISNYETGKYLPTHEHLSKLADLFSVEIADLFEENAEEKQITLAFAFRADEIKTEDLKGITTFKKIIRNYLKLHVIQSI